MAVIATVKIVKMTVNSYSQKCRKMSQSVAVTVIATVKIVKMTK